MEGGAGLIEGNALRNTTFVGRLISLLSFWKKSTQTQGLVAQVKQIEDYRPGYPRFSALIAAHDSYHICRRFSNLRARLLLLKQDKLSLLEKQLERIDEEERAALFLGASRCDRNEERISVLSSIDASLADYDSFIERTQHVLQLELAQPRDILSLQNWVRGNGCMSREETAYLACRKELVNLTSAGDTAKTQLEAWVEDNLIRFYKGFRKNPLHDVSNDPNVFIFSGRLIKRVAQMLLLSLIASLLLAPVVVCNALSTATARIVVIVISTGIFLTVLSSLTKSNTREISLAGAT